MEEIPILILHGWRVLVKRYLPLKNSFIKAGFKVFVPQLPGFAEGEALPKPYTLDDYVQFVIDFVEENKLDKFFLIGHSFGGRVAIKLVACQSEKVKALVLTGVPAVRDKEIKKPFFLILAKIGRAICTIPPLCLLKEGARKILYGLAGEWDYYKARGVMRVTFNKIVTENLVAILPQIKVPTLLIWGESDRTVPVSIAQKMIARIPGAELSIIPDATHRLPYEKTNIFSEKCLEFFNRISIIGPLQKR